MSLYRDLVPPEPFDLAATWFATLGPGGNTTRVDGRGRHYAANTPDGPVAVTIKPAAGRLHVEAWGAGAELELDAMPTRLGFDDPGPGSIYSGGPLETLARHARGLRLGATQRPFEAMVPTILGQRVTSGEAKRGYRNLVRIFGEPAPGPSGLRLPPSPERLATLEYEDFHCHGIERSRAQIVREAARRCRRIDETVAMTDVAAAERLQAIRGIGAWTSGHVMGVALGDRDAVPVGDFHLPNTVAWLLAGEARADDERMLELLERYRPDRRRAVVLIKRSGVSAPKYGPRIAVHDIRGH